MSVPDFHFNDGIFETNRKWISYSSLDKKTRIITPKKHEKIVDFCNQD